MNEKMFSEGSILKKNESNIDNEDNFLKTENGDSVQKTLDESLVVSDIHRTASEFARRSKFVLKDALLGTLDDLKSGYKKFEDFVGKNVIKDPGHLCSLYYEKIVSESLHDPDKKYINIHDILGKKMFQTLDRASVVKDAMAKGIGKLKGAEIFETSEKNEFSYDGGENKVTEYYSNFSNKGASQVSLEFRDEKTGKSVRLNDLLPDKTILVTKRINKEKDEADRSGARAGNVEFVCSSYENGAYQSVEYPEIKETGDMLSLLHEISHSWQNAYYKPFGKSVFKDVLSSLSSLKSIADDKYNEILSKRIDQDDFDVEARLKLKDEYINHLNQFLNNITGVSVRKNDESDLMAGEYKLKDLNSSGELIFKSKKIEKLIKDFERQERDAWAWGIRQLRFLRSQGIDLEPNLQTIDDFKDVIDPCLQSYQDGMEGLVEAGGRGIRFIQKDKD